MARTATSPRSRARTRSLSTTPGPIAWWRHLPPTSRARLSSARATPKRPSRSRVANSSRPAAPNFHPKASPPWLVQGSTGDDMTEPHSGHTVEKIGGTSMSRTAELLDTVLIGKRRGAELYNRIFVVSAYAGMTDSLLEHKKSGEPGVYALFANAEGGWSWGNALNAVAEQMYAQNAEIFSDEGARQTANRFAQERVEGVRSCLIDLSRLCSFGHFQLQQHLLTVREMLASLGEAQSAFNTAMLLNMHGVTARFVDLTGWRDDTHLPLDEVITRAFADIDLGSELPIVSGYAQCSEILMGTYDRGYSEVTLSRVAVVTGASEAIIHKEFHLSSSDPRVVGVDVVRVIGETNYDVADQLSNMGMEAIHPRAAKSLRQADIPLRVKNAFDPEHAGTLSVPICAPGPPRSRSSPG